jgi:Pectate lyase superfamily protein
VTLNRFVAVLRVGLALFLICPAAGADAQTGKPGAGAVNVIDTGATPNDATDDTAAIQAAIDRVSKIYIPAGVYHINPAVGLQVRTGTQIAGDGRTNSILQAMPGGGTTADLITYRRGSIIHRAFDPTRRNAYVTDVRISDLAIVLSHPADRVTKNGIQIGLDLRNIGRSLVERIWVGNIPPGRAGDAAHYSSAFVVQGYGIVLGTVGSSEKAYAGGEVNTIRDCSVWGAYKLVVVDDAVLSPLSAAHATMVDRCDLQAGHHLIGQESEYGAGSTFRDNVVQNVIVQTGNPENTTVLDIRGYDNVFDGGYVETGAAANFVVRLGPQSRNNRITFQHVSNGLISIAADEGRCNRLSGIVAERRAAPNFPAADCSR